MKSLKYILFLLLILVIGFSIYVAVQPNSFEVTRSRTIKAPAAVIYDNVIDYKTGKHGLPGRRRTQIWSLPSPIVPKVWVDIIPGRIRTVLVR